MIMVLLVWFTTFGVKAESLNCTPKQSTFNCLVCNCYFETRGEPMADKIAVAKTVLSRVESDEFPDTACAVVFQPSQFSWTNDSYKNSVKVKTEDRPSLQECRDAVDLAIDEGPNGLLYFYNPRKVTPAWAPRLKNCGRAGQHVFLVPKNKNCPRYLGANAATTNSQPRKSSGGGGVAR